jgi:phosphatidylglycerol:prolipoprotein diacylglycerol transferase
LSAFIAILGAGLLIYNFAKVKKQGPDKVLLAERAALAAGEVKPEQRS